MGQKDMKILLVVRWPVGGIRTFLKYVYRNFSRLECETTLVAPDLPETRVLLGDFEGIRTSPVLLKRNPSATEITKVVNSLLCHGSFDMVHSQGFIAGACCALPAFVSRTPHIISSHDILQESQFNGVSGVAKKYTLSSLIPLADKIHSVSSDAEKNLLQFVTILRAFKKKMITIPNGIDVVQFKKNIASRDFRNECSMPHNSFIIGFFGRFMSQKGFNILVESIELIMKNKNMYRLPYVVSFGEDGFVREEKSRISKKKLDKNFIFLPFVHDITASLKGVDAVVMPSLWEACPLLPMEALVAGTPLIGTDALGLREVLRGTPAMVVPKGDSVALATAIMSAMTSPRKQEAEAYSSEAAIRFDVRRTSAAIEDLFLEVGMRGMGGISNKNSYSPRGYHD